MKLLKMLKNPRDILLFILKSRVFWLIPDKLYLRIKYKLIMNKNLNLKNPQTFNEKMQWLKINNKNTEYTKLVDKYEVRKYISEIMGEEYLIPVLGVYNSFDEIDFDALPEKFVLKCTHDSGGLVICTDKKKLDKKAAKKKINKSLKKNYYYLHREWPYKDVTPRIICEKYMEDSLANELIDYKLMSFNGKVKCIFVCQNRMSKNGLNIDIYDSQWRIMPFERPNHRNSEKAIPKPNNYEKMIELAERCSKNFPFIRVDFYEVNGKLYFGELTLYPGSGFEKFDPESYDYKLGSWIKLHSYK